MFIFNVCPIVLSDCFVAFLFQLKEEKVYSGIAETFGRQWQVGDVVGVFLDLLDHTISKYLMLF